uniref:tRNA-dihydrouridine(16/17) synthase [NAD(P)(+)]-like n=2 Tax=Nicotiana TaxID=4085 RepID=A0A1S4BV05_TOBAC|nr:PREDICTED: tRNA-dihydrouridine(16/17) synthase [NAD(P)(+)]-like [Nicotiana tabacum]
MAAAASRLLPRLHTSSTKQTTLLLLLSATFCYVQADHVSAFASSSSSPSNSSHERASIDNSELPFYSLLEAALKIEPYCDCVDINFGCPQQIAKRRNYGAFLMDGSPVSFQTSFTKWI